MAKAKLKYVGTGIHTLWDGRRVEPPKDGEAPPEVEMTEEQAKLLLERDKALHRTNWKRVTGGSRPKKD